ncbi:hypothetical protein ACHAQJ_004442 [Trichoderma viride]
MSSSQDAEKAQNAATSAPLTMPPAQMNLPAGYQPYPYAAPAAIPYYAPQQAFEAPKPALNKAWEIIKMVLQTLSVILAAVGIGLGFSTLNYVYFSYTVVIAAAPPCIMALVWGLAEMLVRVVRKFKAGIHPGAHIALSLIIFLVGVILTSLFGPWFQDSWNGGADSDENCSYQFNSTTNNYVEVCNNDAYDDADAKRRFNHEKSIAYAAAVVTYIIAIIHFALFVGACVDTSKVNAAASRPIYVIAQPQGLQNMMQGWQPIQQEAPLQAPVQAPVQTTTARDISPMEEDEEQSKSKGKGKEPVRDSDIVEHYAPSGSQA